MSSQNIKCDYEKTDYSCTEINDKNYINLTNTTITRGRNAPALI